MTTDVGQVYKYGDKVRGYGLDRHLTDRVMMKAKLVMDTCAMELGGVS